MYHENLYKLIGGGRADSLPSEESAMKIIYLNAAEINKKCSVRTPMGILLCRDEIGKMFQKRYP